MPGSPFAMKHVLSEFSFNYQINPTLEIICIYCISHTFHYDGHMLGEYDNDTQHNVTQCLITFQFSHRLYGIDTRWAIQCIPCVRYSHDIVFIILCMSHGKLRCYLDERWLINSFVLARSGLTTKQKHEIGYSNIYMYFGIYWNYKSNVLLKQTWRFNLLHLALFCTLWKAKIILDNTIRWIESVYSVFSKAANLLCRKITARDQEFNLSNINIKNILSFIILST